MEIIGGPSLGAATSAAPGDDMDANAVVHAARFRKERAMASGATRAAERKKRRALHHMATAVGSHAYSGSDKSTKPCGRNQHARCSQPNRCTKLGHYTRSDYHKRTQESHCIKPYKVRATTFKKDRSRASAATRATERKKKKAMLQTSVVSIQAVAPGPTAKVIPATASKRNSVVAPSMPVALSRVNEMSPPNTPSFDLVLTLAATDQPKTTNGSTAQRNKVSKSTENLNLELTLGTLG
uniref:Uncharacterized protein n=1 Tax=Oryza nivara TaxID=4536 RepID=A0A0E0J9N2_ORYNI